MFSRSLRACLAAAILCVCGAAWASTENALQLDALRGRVVYVDFWASWCGPCRQSFPWMTAMQQRYGERGLTVVAVNLDQDRALADEFLSTFRPPFRVVFDADAKLAEQFHVVGMPSSYFIDRKGNTRYRHVGFRAPERAELEQELQTLLNEQ